MDELFRFYALYRPDPLTPEQHISLDSPSSAPVDNEGTARRESTRVLDDEREALPRELTRMRSLVDGIARRIEQEQDEERSLPVDAWVRDIAQRSLSELAEDPAFKRGTDRLKDAVVALRLLHDLGPAPAPEPEPDAICHPAPRNTQPPTPVLRRMVRPATTATARIAAMAVRVPPLSAADELRPLAGEMMRHIRVRQFLSDAAARPMTLADARAAMSKPMTTARIGPIRGVMNRFPIHVPTEADLLAEARANLEDLTQLLLRVGRACPYETQLFEESVQLTKATSDELLATYGELLDVLDDLPGASASAALTGQWAPGYATLESKAKYLVRMVLDLEKALAASGNPPATTTTFAPTVIGGHMQFAGLARVHVFHDHVTGYSRGELAHIENVLEGESRSRSYRTLTRREEETETATETTTTEEREIKTEERFELKTESDKVLKEALDVKASVDLQASIGSTLKLGINTSVGYTRTKEETNKVATDFAKDVTNRAARKVSETVRNVSRVRILRETEETVAHDFDNSPVGSGNITGLYQWVEKVHETRHFTPGHTSAIFDGVVVQPGQRLLGVPKSSDGTGPVNAPPSLDITARDVHPWNYLELGARHGTSQLPVPPSLTTTLSHAVAQGGSNQEAPGAAAQDIVITEGYHAGFATVTWYCGPDIVNDEPSRGHAQISLGATKLTAGAAADNKGDRGKQQVLLTGERNAMPFAGLFYGGYGFQCATQITCARTVEAYEAWQLSVFTALDAAHLRAVQAYEEKIANLSVQQAYDYGPSPGRVDQVVREELKRCVLGVLARQVAGKRLFDRIDDYYAAGNTAEVARLALIYEHAFEWDQMTYVLYPYFWADGHGDGWNAHTNRDEKNDDLAAFLRAGAARVMVPLRSEFLKKISDPDMVKADLAAILGETLTLDELLNVNSPLQVAIENELGKPKKYELIETWQTRVPTELVVLRDSKVLPKWTWTDDGSGGTWSES